MPVTLTARASEEYTDYLSRSGEDNAAHYDVKIAASRLLIDHVGDTFTTPVFNGSASLRDASGQLIENTVKSVRRKETIDDAYMEKLFGNITSLYRLNRLSAQVSAGEKSDLGPLPPMSAALLGILAAVWVLLGGFAVWNLLKKKRTGNR